MLEPAPTGAGTNAWQRVRAVFDAALDLPAAERERYVAAACGTDAGLRAQVAALLAADARCTAAAAFEAAPPSLAVAPLPTGARLGEYRILRLLGRGGMGAVYAAEQDRPHRVVALKVMQHAFASPHAERRLLVEAEILGRLNHPAIAQVFAAATAQLPDGLAVPYFAMELVEGATDLCTFAQTQRLVVAARLRLMVTVADAVHHGHQKGVIHRDLKPANVLVDAAGRVKVIDFGIARLRDHDAQAQTLLTQTGQIVGTLAYMSPEQIDGSAAAIDVRSDVYALGVMAYELLTGQLPLDLRGKSLTAAATAIRGEEPQPLAAHDRAWRGDLDTIVSTAMAKEPSRRYASADALARDLERFLRREPIQARPPGALYVLSRFAARHKVVVAISATASLLLLLGAGALVWQNARVRAENKKARWVSAFLSGVLAEADGLDARGERYTVREALDEAAKRLAASADIDPEIEAELRATIGSTYHALSALGAAEPHLERALHLRRAALGDEARETLHSLNALLLLRRDQDRLDEALPLARECARIASRRFGADDDLALVAAHNLALMLKDAGEHEAAEALARDTLDRRRRVLGADNAQTLHTAHNLGSLLLARNELAQAEAILTDTLARRERALAPDHADTLLTRDVLGQVWRERGDLDAAVEAHRAAGDGLEQRLGAQHHATLGARFHLAWALYAREEFAAAENVGRQALATCRSVLGDEHRYTMRLLRVVASAVMKQDRAAEAEPMFAEAHACSARTHGERDPDTVLAAHDLAFCLLRAGKPAAGLRLLEPLVAGDLPDHLVASGELMRGRCFLGVGDAASAVTAFTRSHALFSAAGVVPGARNAAKALADLFTREGRSEDAARWAAAAR